MCGGNQHQKNKIQNMEEVTILEEIQKMNSGGNPKNEKVSVSGKPLCIRQSCLATIKKGLYCQEMEGAFTSSCALVIATKKEYADLSHWADHLSSQRLLLAPDQLKIIGDTR